MPFSKKNVAILLRAFPPLLSCRLREGETGFSMEDCRTKKVFSVASASFKFNYQQEQADNRGITIIIITRDERGVTVSSGHMVTPFVHYSLILFHIYI